MTTRTDALALATDLLDSRRMARAVVERLHADEPNWDRLVERLHEADLGAMLDKILAEVAYSDELAEAWLADAGQAGDDGTVARAREALDGDVDAQADVVRWERAALVA